MGEPATCEQEFPVVRLGGPADLVDAVPYLLGFHPENSIVMIAVRGRRRRVGLTLRVDIPAADAVAQVIDNCVEHLLHAGADGLLIAVYPPGPPEPGEDLPHAEAVTQIAAALADDEVELIEAVLVAGGRWWSFLCSNPMCCPPEGREVRNRREPSAVMAAATVAGMSVAADREELARTLQPLPRTQRRRLVAHVDREADRWQGPEREGRAQAAGRAWRAGILAQEHGENALHHADAALLLVGLRDVAVRDECCAAVREEHRTGAFALARQLARRATPPWDAAPYTLTSWLAWLDGNGVLARFAIDRALVSDPDYRLALLMEQLLDCGVDPSAWSMPTSEEPLTGC